MGGCIFFEGTRPKLLERGRKLKINFMRRERRIFRKVIGAES